jgi:hypothetical protein
MGRRIDYWQYKEYSYDPWDETIEDKYTRYHNVIETKTKHYAGTVPISGYSLLSKEAFEAWIDSGMPSREMIGRMLRKRMSSPPTNDQLIEYRVEQILLGENDE